MNVDLVNDNVLPLMKELTYGGFNLGDVITSLSVSLIVVGTIVLIIATLGAIGAFCNRPACLDIVSILTRLSCCKCKYMYMTVCTSRCLIISGLSPKNIKEGKY